MGCWGVVGKVEPTPGRALPTGWGRSASAGWSAFLQNISASLLPVWKSPEAAVASAEFPALLSGGGQTGEAGPRAGPQRSRGAAGAESGGPASPPSQPRLWPLLPTPPSSPPRLLSKINRAIACRNQSSERSGREKPRARPRLPGPAPVAAQRTAPRLWGPTRPPVPCTLRPGSRGPRQHRGQLPGPAHSLPAHPRPESAPRTAPLDPPRCSLGVAEAPRNMATEVGRRVPDGHRGRNPREGRTGREGGRGRCGGGGGSPVQSGGRRAGVAEWKRGASGEGSPYPGISICPTST